MPLMPGGQRFDHSLVPNRDFGSLRNENFPVAVLPFGMLMARFFSAALAKKRLGHFSLEVYVSSRTRSWVRSTTAAMAVILCSALPARTAQAATRVVNSTGDVGDGICDASCTLRDAVTGAQAGDTIALGSLEVVLTQGPLVVNRNLTFTGSGASINGGGTQQLFQVTSGTVAFAGITFTGGTSAGADGLFGGADGGMGGSGAGGALWLGTGADVTVEGCTFLSNGATGGRGANAPTTGSGNGGQGGAARGGAAYVAANATLSVKNSQFKWNVVLAGAGGNGSNAPVSTAPGANGSNAGDGGNGGEATGSAISNDGRLFLEGYNTFVSNAVSGGAGGTGGKGADGVAGTNGGPGQNGSPGGTGGNGGHAGVGGDGLGSAIYNGGTLFLANGSAFSENAVAGGAGGVGGNGGLGGLGGLGGAGVANGVGAVGPVGVWRGLGANGSGRDTRWGIFNRGQLFGVATVSTSEVAALFSVRQQQVAVSAAVTGLDALRAIDGTVTFTVRGSGGQALATLAAVVANGVASGSITLPAALAAGRYDLVAAYAPGASGAPLAHDTISTLTVNLAPMLVNSRALAVGNTNCPFGGAAIDQGRDDGGNTGVALDGILQTDEVSQTLYVCAGEAGANGFNSLVKLGNEAQGANCQYGGVRIDTGLDNGAGGGVMSNGTLESGEITATRYVCAGAPAVNGQNGFNSLVSIRAEPAGTNCPFAGQRIDTGTDNGAGGGVSGNGMLESGEITGTSYVCASASGTNGSNGFSALLKVSVEPTGANCTFGGQRVDTGLDNGAGSGVAQNATLEDGEIARTTYLCAAAAPAAGTDGKDGFQSLIRTTTEAAGSNCEAGGQRIETGRDNGAGRGVPNNSVLEDGEVESTAYVCNAVAAQQTNPPGGCSSSGGFASPLALLLLCGAFARRRVRVMA